MFCFATVSDPIVIVVVLVVVVPVVVVPPAAAAVAVVDKDLTVLTTQDIGKTLYSDYLL